MRVKSGIVLIAIVFSIFSPRSLHLAIAHGHTSIEGFDVCHSGSPGLSTGHDARRVNEPLYRHCLPSSVYGAEIFDPTHRILILASQEEHPPKN